MQHYLCWTTYHDIAASKLILQSTVEPLRGTSLIIPPCLVRTHRNNFTISRVAVDDWNMSKFFALIPDLLGIVGCIH